MGISIDLVINNLSGILTEATESEDSVCYVTEDDAETLKKAIDVISKYQKIVEIVNKWQNETDPKAKFARSNIENIKEVIEDECSNNINTYNYDRII